LLFRDGIRIAPTIAAGVGAACIASACTIPVGRAPMASTRQVDAAELVRPALSRPVEGRSCVWIALVVPLGTPDVAAAIDEATLPAGMGLVLLAPLLVGALYPPAWADMATPLRIFAVFGLANSLVATTGDVFKAANRPGWIAALALVHLPVLAGGLWLLVGRAPNGAAAALLLAALASGAIAVPLALGVLGLPARRLLGALAPQAIATSVMGM
jgi:hypothetical protein